MPLVLQSKLRNSPFFPHQGIISGAQSDPPCWKCFRLQGSWPESSESAPWFLTTKDSFTTTHFSCHMLGKQSVFIFSPSAYLIGGLAGLWTKKMERNKVPGTLTHNLLEQHISRAQTASVTTQVLLVPRQSRPSLLLSANPLAWLCSRMPSRLLDPAEHIKWHLDLQIHPR